jgi:hypothetical protein
MLVEGWRRARTHERREKKQKDPILRELWDSGFFPRSFLQIRVRMMQHIECIVKLNSNQAGRSASWQRLCFKVGLAVAGVD